MPSGEIFYKGEKYGGSDITGGAGIDVTEGNVINHTNSVTAGTAAGTATSTLDYGDSFNIPSVTYDAQGHITAKGTTTLTLPQRPISGVGLNTTGVEYEIDEETYVGGEGAEIFNDYEYNKGIGAYSHTEGNQSVAIGDAAHAEGENTKAIGDESHSEGHNTVASGLYSHAEGLSTEAAGEASHSEGYSTQSLGNCAHTEGAYNIGEGDYSHAEGYQTTAQGDYAHSEGMETVAKGNYSHVEGAYTEAGLEAHAEGYRTRAQKDQSHSEGNYTVASGTAAHAEGINSRSFEAGAHAEGNHGDDFLVTLTSTDNSLVYTYTTTAIVGPRAGDIIVENGTGGIHQYKALITASNSTNKTITLNQTLGTKDAVQYIVSSNGAIGSGSHIEGYNTKAIGAYSHAGGQQTVAMCPNQTVIGKNNIVDSNNTYAFIVGNGANNANRSNAFAVDWNGVIYGATGGSILVDQGASVQISNTAKVHFGTKLLPSDILNKAIYINSQGSTIDVSTGANIIMNNGAQLNMSSGGQFKIKQGSLLKIGDVGNPDPDGNGDILITGHHYYQIPEIEGGGSEIGESSALLSDSSIILKSYDRYKANTAEALDPQYSLLSLADNAKVTINQLEDTQASPKFNFTLSQIKPASTGNNDTVDVGTNVEISSEKLSVNNTIKQALQYNQGAGVLDKYKINFGDSLLIENYKLDYDSNDEYATTVDACQSISISKSAYITIVGGNSASSDQDTVISITRPKIMIEDCDLDLSDSEIQTLNNFDFYGNGGNYSLKSGTIDIDSGSVSIKENSNINLSGGTSITGNSTKVSIKIGSNPAVDFTYADLLKLRELIDEGPQIERTVGQVVGLLGGSTNSVEGQTQEVNE